MALKEIKLDELIEFLDEEKSEYADFFRPMLGYEAYLELHMGINDEYASLLDEIDAETGFELPPDLVSFYICTNGAKFGDLTLFPIINDPKNIRNMHTLNVLDKSIKEKLNLPNSTLLIGNYDNTENYITCRLNSKNVYVYELYDADKKEVLMSFDYLIQPVSLEMSYITDEIEGNE